MPAVTPQDPDHASRSSSPGTSYFDGTPLYVSPSTRIRRRSHPSGVSDMTIKPTRRYDDGLKDHGTKPLRVVSSSALSDSGPSPLRVQAPLPRLSDLTRLLQLERYERQRRLAMEHQLWSTLVAAARTARLLQHCRSVRRTLAECVKLEDKPSFLRLINAFDDALSDSCAPLPGPPVDPGTDTGDACGFPPSFLDGLQGNAQDALLEFLSKVRTDGHFIADRLATLNTQELLALLSARALSGSDESVFGSSPRPIPRISRNLGSLVDGQIHALSSNEFASPLDVLVHIVRGTIGGSIEADATATDVWATVCARLISEQKSGSDKIVSTVIDVWAHSSSWPGRTRIDTWLLQTLQQGTVVLEDSHKQSFSMPMQASQILDSEDDNRLEDFYTNAVRSLLCLLTDSTAACVIPEGARNLCAAISKKLRHSPRHHKALPNFVITRWLFSRFLHDAVVSPEIYGLIPDYFVNENIRQRILREIFARCERNVIGVVYAWKYGIPSANGNADLIRKLADQLVYTSKLTSPSTTTVPSGTDAAESIAVSANDVVMAVRALYPTRRSPSMTQHDSPQLGLRSSASSISWFSLFRTALGPGPTFDRTSELTVGASAHQNSTLPSTRGAMDEIPNRSSPAVLDDARLLEACSNVEDFLIRRHLTVSERWCILTSNLGTRQLCTLRGKLLDISLDEMGSTIDPLPSMHAILRDVFAELLVTGDLQGRDAPSTSLQVEASAQLQEIERALTRRVEDLEASTDFLGAHTEFHGLCRFKEFAEHGQPEAYRKLTQEISAEKESSMRQSSATVEKCGAYLRLMKPDMDQHPKAIADHVAFIEQLRDKMWYAAEVRVSSVYDETRAIASALKTMGTRQSLRTHPAPSRGAISSKSSTTGFQMKTEAQILELLSAPASQGVHGKLGDEQCRTLATWMERNNVDNLCRGEERLHKLCMEIRRAVDKLLDGVSTPVSSSLYSRDQLRAAIMRRRTSANGYWTLPQDGKGPRGSSLPAEDYASYELCSNSSSDLLSTRSSRDRLGSWSPSVSNKSSTSFWSPVLTEAQSPSSATSIGSSRTEGASLRSAKYEDPRESSEQLRKRITSFLLSDLATTLFGDGSETDLAIWSGVGAALTTTYLRSLHMDTAIVHPEQSSKQAFDYYAAFSELTLLFSAACDPHAKLQRLYEIDALLPFWQSEALRSRKGSETDISGPTSSTTPREEATSVHNGDNKVEGFRRLFSGITTRPESIFRDLQYIAAFVPTAVLETTPEGKAFWNAAAAASSLKRGICSIMVETADKIIAHQSDSRSRSRSPSIAQQEWDTAAFTGSSTERCTEDISKYSMADAATMLQITAREGYPVAQRELATLYLTNPELMDRIIAPLSCPRDVFKRELEKKWRGHKDTTRCDPTIMCVAHHWMSLSSKGGDALATEFLRQREEMERLP